MMKMRLSLGAALLAILSSHGVFAAPIPLSSLVDNGNYSSDLISGLDWLDVTLTYNQSFNQVLAGQYVASGWRYATVSEFSSLLARFGSGDAAGYYSTSNYDQVVALVRQLGVSASYGNAEGVVINPATPDVLISAQGRLNDESQFQPNGYEGQGTGAIWAYLSGGGMGYRTTWGYSIDSMHPNYVWSGSGMGSFLVRDSSAVPEPSSFVLALFGFLGLALNRQARGRSSA